MAEHNNQVESEVYLDVQFFSCNYAKIKINALKFNKEYDIINMILY